MPRFFFDIDNGRRRITDGDGTECADLTEAHEEATGKLGHIGKDELPNGDHREFSVEVRDEDGNLRLKSFLALRTERYE